MWMLYYAIKCYYLLQSTIDLYIQHMFILLHKNVHLLVTFTGHGTTPVDDYYGYVRMKAIPFLMFKL